MERTPTFLAALASAGVPGLDPVSVEALPSVPEQDYDVAFVQDSEHRRWVVRAPRSEAAGARMDLTVTLLQMLARRLPFTIPAPRGFVELKGGGRAMIYPFLPGHNLAFDEMPAGPGPAAELGRALAALHNTDVRLFDEAGMPTYDTDSYRRRRLTELDRAAESGRVPTGLLTRWEHALEDVALWRFAPTCIHGDLTGDQVLAVFEDDTDASTGRIRGITGWEDAKVADPADDFAALVDEAEPAALETVLEAYAHARVERPDANLLVRARLAAELGILAGLMRADARGDLAAVEGFSSRLRRLDEEVHTEDPTDDYRRGSLTPVALRARATPPPLVADDDEDEDEDDVFAPTPADDGSASGASSAAGGSGSRTGLGLGTSTTSGVSTDTDVIDLGDRTGAGPPPAARAETGTAAQAEPDTSGDGEEPAPELPADELAGNTTARDAVGQVDATPADSGSVEPRATEPVAHWHDDDDDEVAWVPRSFPSSGPIDTGSPVTGRALPPAER